MTGVEIVPLCFVVAIGLGIWATRFSRTASDFFVASRSVSVGWNASAISGEYLSAASFMGVAALVMKNGYDALWYPVCYAAGYLFLLLFIAGPLRRFGAYTIPDFAEGRFDSPLFRRIAVTFVLFIGFFYTMPQMKGAGVTMNQILNWPYWVGIVVVGTIITFNVAMGGMKGITFVQAFQYWAKMFAISAPVFVIMSEGGPVVKNGATEKTPPKIEFEKPTKIVFLAGAPIPNTPTNHSWLEPFGTLSGKWGYPLLYTYSLIIALVCGTAGLPHILVRFYTNPDGTAAKRTTIWVMILIGVFYLFSPVFGVLGRNLFSELYAPAGGKGTDKVVLGRP